MFRCVGLSELACLDLYNKTGSTKLLRFAHVLFTPFFKKKKKINELSYHSVV